MSSTSRLIATTDLPVPGPPLTMSTFFCAGVEISARSLPVSNTSF